jgi:CcmD family protein
MLLTLIMNLLLQEAAVPMADALRENGKIWVVVGVILIAFLGIILYLISLDRKITKLEKES